MRNQTRFEGKVQVTNLPALKAAARVMNDHQLQFFFKAFKTNGLPEQKKVIMDEMAVRVLADYLTESEARYAASKIMDAMQDVV